MNLSFEESLLQFRSLLVSGLKLYFFIALRSSKTTIALACLEPHINVIKVAKIPKPLKVCR
jgi:hypothetical protein